MNDDPDLWIFRLDGWQIHAREFPGLTVGETATFALQAGGLGEYSDVPGPRDLQRIWQDENVYEITAERRLLEGQWFVDAAILLRDVGAANLSRRRGRKRGPLVWGLVDIAADTEWMDGEGASHRYRWEVLEVWARTAREPSDPVAAVSRDTWMPVERTSDGDDEQARYLVKARRAG